MPGADVFEFGAELIRRHGVTPSGYVPRADVDGRYYLQLTLAST